MADPPGGACVTDRPRKTKIEGGTSWRWYSEPDADRDHLALATYLQLASAWSLPRFEWHTLMVMRQLRRTPGLIGYSFRGDFPTRFWTLSAWVNGKALGDFVRDAEHNTAVRVTSPMMEKFEAKRWKVPADAIPLVWDEALQRLDS